MDRHPDLHHRDRDRDRGRDRYGGGGDYHHQPRRPTRFSDGPPPPSTDHRRSPSSYRVGGGGGGGSRRAFDSPPRHPPSGGFHPGDGVPPPGPPGGFRPMGGGFGNDFQGPPPPLQPQAPPLSGQKRGFPFSGRGGSPEHHDGKNFVKLFVGSVPRTATEEQIRPLFEDQGNVLEVALIKDKRTGQQQGCCFIKYATSEEADRAIRALHNQYTLPGGVGPIQVRYADGERERLGNGAVEYKLFVGSLSKLASEKEVEEIFAPYGRIEDVYLMRDERKQSRGCGFVKFSSKDSAMAAINALNGLYTMRGCDQPLSVRFADPKRPRAGEPRTGPTFGGPGSSPVPPPGIRPAPGPNFAGSMGGRGPSNAWQPMSPQNSGPSPNTGIHGFGNQLPPRSGDIGVSPSPGDNLGPQGNLRDGSAPGAVSSASPKNFNQSFPPQGPPSSQQISPLQKSLPSPQHFPVSLQLPPGPGSYSQTHLSQAPMRPINQLQTGVQAPYSQAFPSQPVPGLGGQYHPVQFQPQPSVTSATAQPPQMSINGQPSTSSSLSNRHMHSPSPQQPLPSQLAQMMTQQTQNVQASYQSSQQAFSQLQQQVQMMQPSNQNHSLQQSYQAPKQQSQWPGVAPTAAPSTPAVAASVEAPSTSSAPVDPVVAPTPALKCNWTEHTSPDGYKYYYNSMTNESRWVKPEELTLYEQQQQKSCAQQPQGQPTPHAVPTQQVTQLQPPQFQTQFRHSEQWQRPPPSSMYQAPRVRGSQNFQEATYTKMQAPANSAMDPARYQQGFQPAQDWSWKGNSGGS